MSKVIVPALDNILGHEFKVLDKGFVRCVDYMGGDASIVQAARVSYGAGTKKVSEDEGLIRYLMRHSHTTPFEMCEIKFHVKVPMDCWRQWIRHRTANVNEYSTRYSEAIDDKQVVTEWRTQDGGNKQGSSGLVEQWPADSEKLFCRMEKDTPSSYLSRNESVLHEYTARIYRERLAFGVAREQARKDLPLSTYTEAYWKIDLHNLLHFLKLRMDSHAQLEIRQYANAIGSIVSTWVPLTWAAFVDYKLEGMVLSKREVEVIKGCSNKDGNMVASGFGWLETKKDGSLINNRERMECEDKLKKLGLLIPWR